VDFILGFIVGAAVVGSSVGRTLAVHNLSYSAALKHSAINSLAYYASIRFIAQDNIPAYVGTALGSTLVILYMIAKEEGRRGAK
jgi:hypothetical protein